MKFDGISLQDSVQEHECGEEKNSREKEPVSIADSPTGSGSESRNHLQSALRGFQKETSGDFTEEAGPS